MSHLSPERLAALADEAPTPDEAGHLAGCAACARERAAQRALMVLAAEERERPGSPITDWDSLAESLSERGLIVRAPRRTRLIGRQWLEAAAAVLLVGGGAILGRYTVISAPDTDVAVPAAAGGDRGQIVPVSGGAQPAPRTNFASMVDAATTLARAAQEYQAALAYLASQDTLSRSVDSTDVYRTRLAALDAVAATTRQAMEAAPYDPVINRYYLTTMGAREATLQQLNASLPADLKLTRY